MKSLVLVGLMGAGKSTVGGLVARQLGWPLVDVDAAILTQTGSTVRQLWESGGEAAYRRLESEVVVKALGHESTVVVAAPGGVVLDPLVRSALKDAFVVWLRGAPATLAGRVQPGDHRPLLGDDPLAVLTTMSADRSHLYAQTADAVVDTDGLDAGEVAQRVIDLLPALAPEERQG